MRAHYLQHVSFEGLGSIETWLQKAGCQISCTRLFTSDKLPKIEDIDFLVVMGGPMSVNDEQDHPWLKQEKEFIRGAIETGKPVLGICLGAQLIANCLGEEVYPNPIKEIGWLPVNSVNSEDISVFRFPDKIEVFHWHGETFNLPQEAVLLASSQGCRNQAFQIGKNVLGLQFHLETTPISARALIENCRHELTEGEYIQAEDEILSVPPERYLSINNLMSNILAYLVSGNDL